MASLDSASVTDRSVSLCSTPPGSPGAYEAGSPREEEHFVRMQERKRRNRESAERSRKRKFQFYKEIEKTVAELKAENERLWRAYGQPSTAAAAVSPAVSPAAPRAEPPALALENERLRARVAELEALLAASRQQPLTLQPQPESAPAVAVAATDTDLVIKHELDELLKPLPLQPQLESAAAGALSETTKQELLDELLIMDHLVEEEGDDGDFLRVGEDVDDLLVTGAAVSKQPASSLTPISTRWLLAHPSLDSSRSDSDSDSYTRARTVKPFKSFQDQLRNSDFVVAADVAGAKQGRTPLEEKTSPSAVARLPDARALRISGLHERSSTATPSADSSSSASATTARNEQLALVSRPTNTNTIAPAPHAGSRQAQQPQRQRQQRSQRVEATHALRRSAAPPLRRSAAPARARGSSPSSSHRSQPHLPLR